MAIYYVRADGTVTAANKTNATSDASASTSLSMASVNSATFLAGDSVLFSDTGGDYTAGLIVPSSGSISLPVTFSNIPGQQPLIANTSGDSISLTAKVYINISGFLIHSTSSTSFSKAINISGICTNINISGIDATQTVATSRYSVAISGNSTGIVFDNCSFLGGITESIYCYGTTVSGVSIKNTTVDNRITLNNINGLSIENLTVTNAPQNKSLSIITCSGVLLINGLIITGGSPGDSSFRVLNSSFSNGSLITGLVINGNSIPLNGFLVTNSSNVQVENSNVYNVAGTGFLANGASHDLLYTNCKTEGKGGFWLADGVYNVRYFKCSALDGASDGFGMLDSTGVTHDITYDSCLSLRNGNKLSTANGDGFTCHLNNYNINLYNCIAAYNICSGFAMVGQSSGVIYNCLAFANAGNWSIEGGGKLDQVRAGFYVQTDGNNPTTGTGWIVKNSIGVSNYPREIRTNPLYATFDYNLYHPTNPTVFAMIDGTNVIPWDAYHAVYEAHSIMADPLFVSNLDYHLSTDSPCLGTGTKIPGVTTDIENNPLFPPYNIGPFSLEAGALGVAPVVNDGAPRNNITRITGASTTIDPAATYILDDTNAWRVVTGWAAGTANFGFDENGVPIPFTGQQLIDAGIGPRLYCGSKGIGGYTVDQDAAANAKIIRTLKVPTYIDTLYYSDFQEMDWSASNE